MYIVIGYLDFDVGYGVDSSSYIFGIFDSLEKANDYVNSVKDKTDYFLCNGEKRYSVDDFYDAEPAQYKDISYYVEEFTGEPIRCGGACYLE